jgi:methionyl aminopeptidase
LPFSCLDVPLTRVRHLLLCQAYGIMQPGHIFCIEPMLNVGTEWRDLSWPDDWTVTTIDGARSAAAEETILITETGVEVLTAKGGSKTIDTRENRKDREEQLNESKKRKAEAEVSKTSTASNDA